MAQIEHGDGFETLAIHAGQEPDPLTGAVVPPIYQVSTFKQDGVGGLRGGRRSASGHGASKHGASEHRASEHGAAGHGGVVTGPGRWVEGYEYSRTANPTRGALEECLAALEGGVRALAFASGMAAEDCLVRAVCQPGDHVLIPHDAYGGTYRLFDKVMAGWGVTYDPVPISDAEAVRAAAAAHRPTLIWVESPTNPLLSIADIAALAQIARAAGALLAVDNTFASPYLQQPLALGADAVIHSTTKYLGGHSDVVGGALIVTDTGLAERLAFLRNAVGSAGAPFDSWLTLRGVKTLGVRMDRHCDNGAQVAKMLANHPRVAQVYYPGLPDHPAGRIARRGGVADRAPGADDARIGRRVAA